MEFVVIIYHGTSPLPGSPAWKSLPSSEQKAIYADYASCVTYAPCVSGCSLLDRQTPYAHENQRRVKR